MHWNQVSLFVHMGPINHLHVCFYSVAHTEATMVMAYLFRNFDMNLKTNEFRHRDSFTQQVLKPGVLVEFTPL